MDTGGQNSRKKGLTAAFVIAALLAAASVILLAVYTGGGAGGEKENKPAAGVLISEFMPVNKNSYFDSAGDTPDWIEVTNTGSGTVNLFGMSLSDSRDQPGAFVFPNISLKPGGFVVVLAGGKNAGGPLHASFGLRGEGEEIVLFDSSGGVIDSVEYTGGEAGMSFARDYTSGKLTKTAAISPGFENTEKGAKAYTESLVSETTGLAVNEVCPKNYSIVKDADGDYSGWVEVINTSERTLNLALFGLSDNTAERLKWAFPEKELAPGQVQLVFLSGKNRAEGELHASFKLGSQDTALYLNDRSGKLVESVPLPANLAPDTSYGKSGDRWQVFGEPTPGYPNTREGLSEFYSDFLKSNTSGLYINEVMLAGKGLVTDSDGADCDWIELGNRGDKPLRLSDFTLSDDAGKPDRFRLPDKMLGAGEYIVVKASGSAGSGKNSMEAPFSLSSGEAVILSDQAGIIDRVKADFSVLASPAAFSIGKAGDLSMQYMAQATPGRANAAGWKTCSGTPVFSVQGGVFAAGGFTVALSAGEGAEIRYTLDSTTPGRNSALYTEPIAIQTTTVIRARAYQNGAADGPVTASTYIIAAGHDLPVVCVTATPASLYAPGTGIYTNYELRKEVPAHIEFYDGGVKKLDQNFALRIFGSFSRMNAAKSFALLARSSYGPSTFACKLFNTQPYTQYESFLLRNGASETAFAKIVDVMLCSLVRDTTRVATQDFRPSVLYVNGEYYGVYFIQEKINEAYIAQHYGVSKKSVNLLQANGGKVISGEKTAYTELYDFVKSHDMSVQANYDYAAKRMDIDDYTDYVICEMYVNNTDTGNIKFWMSDEYDGRWRWIFYDVDWAFWFEDMNGLKFYTNPEGNGVGHFFRNDILRGLLKNPAYKKKFIERFAYHINVTFEPGRVIARIDEIAGMIDSEMPRDKERWGGSYSGWKGYVDAKRDYARYRNKTAKQQLQDYFGLSDARMKELFG
ncbi:MAG TPA: lamin tail domain-containing protein [Clostridiales bacterium]|nr:MAG: CotH protein [Firmicutes bacterium ADurb.Bin262]HOU10924.1 lamin tail domain-containing protein [Clostridiales bacterium]HQK72464.1 lamin tail domain-containing protein [Clostridiales bacterium]